MEVLEKILEEIEDYLFEKYCIEYDDGVEKIIRSHINELPHCGNCSRRKWYQIGYKDCENNIKNNGWISVKERLPEEHDSVFVKLKGTDLWNDAMFEKRSDEVQVTVELENGTRKVTVSRTLDGKWKIEKDKLIKKKVVAWIPLESYEGE